MHPHEYKRVISYRKLAEALRQARLRAGFSQTEAGLLVGRGRQWVSKIETLEVKLDLIQLILLCKAYNLKAHDLVRRMEEGVP